MRIAVVSDTHLRAPTPWLREVYETYMEPADYLLHCGDMAHESVLEFFQQHAGFYGVAGNMDGWAIAHEVPGRQELDMEGVRVGMVHGYGYGHELSSSIAQDFGPNFDLVCFGHSHVFEWTQYNGMHVLNPGSLTSPRKGAPSMALVELVRDGESKEFFVTHVTF